MDIIGKHQQWMTQALREAEIALKENEVPVGAVIVKDGTIIARSHNRREALIDPTAHAEILAITSAATTLADRRLNDCTMYVTLEPCPMCAGAALNARLSQIVFGARDADVGACGTVYDLVKGKNMIHEIGVLPGVLEEESKALLSDFFDNVRTKKKSSE